MKIAFDILPCLTASRDRGIGRYARSLLEAITEAGQEVLLTIDRTDPTRVREMRRTLRARGLDLPSAMYSYPSNEHTDGCAHLENAAGLLRSRFLGSIDADVVLLSSLFEYGSQYSTHLEMSHLRGKPTAAIVYDLIPLHFPERYLPANEFVSRWYVRRLDLLKHIDLLLAISEATRTDLIERLGIRPERIRVIGAGFDQSLAGAEHLSMDQRKKALHALGIHKPYVLTVGNNDWRKNSLGAVEAFAALPKSVRSQHQLVLTQVGDDVRHALDGGKLSAVREDVVICGHVTDEQLSTLYASCKVFFFPSYYEGFGLPVLEAMALGVPVITSGYGALREVIHNERMIFDPQDKRETTRALLQALTNDELRSELAAGSVEHATTFTWRRCADLTVDALKELTEQKSPIVSRIWRPAWLPTDQDIEVLANAVETCGDIAQLRVALDCFRSRSRRVLIDVSELAQRDARTGIQRVVRNIARNAFFAARSFDCRIELIRWHRGRVHYARSFAREALHVDMAGGDDAVVPEPGDIAFMLDSSWLHPERFDSLHHAVASLGGEVVWMLYDLIPLTHPEYCDSGMPPAFFAWLRHAVRSADGFVCISSSTRRHLEDFIAAEGVKIRPWTRVAYLGSDLDENSVASTDCTRSVLAAVASTPIFIAVGTVEPRKDHTTVLDAFDALWARDVDAALVIVGKRGWNVDALVSRIENHPELGRRLHWLQDCPDGDLLTLYKSGRSLIQASREEGFGLPIVEAAACGLPAILSRIPVFEELAGPTAVYFASGDATALAERVREACLTPRQPPQYPVKLLPWHEVASNVLSTLLGASSIKSSRGCESQR